MIPHLMKVLKIYHIAVNENKLFLITIKSMNKYSLLNIFIAFVIILLDVILFFGLYLAKIKDYMRILRFKFLVKIFNFVRVHPYILVTILIIKIFITQKLVIIKLLHIY